VCSFGVLMKLFCRFVYFFALVLVFALPEFGQQPQVRLRGPIGNSGRDVLPHSRVPLAADAEEVGAIPPSTPVPGVTLVFRRSDTQENALQELLAAQQNPQSPLYHRWLKPDEFASRFGVAEGDIAAAEAWLTGQGFHIDSVARSRDRVTFSGTAAQIQAAFGAELRRYRVGDEMHFAPANDLSLPADLAPITAAVLHLSDFRPKAQIRTQTIVQPELTTASSQQHYLTPRDIATMYNLTALYQKGQNGAGQSIAVVGQSYVNTSSSPFLSFFNAMNLRMNTALVLVPGSGVNAISPGDEGESELDLEYASGIATGSDIFLVYVGSNQNYDVFDSLTYAITEDIAPVVTISYGTCELALSQTTLAQANSLFEQASAQGQTLVAASGDDGSTQCSRFTPAQGVTAAQQQALSVSFPAGSPFVSAVGGTQMTAETFASGSNSYWQSAGGIDVAGSLLSYVPEIAWNESSPQRTLAGGGGSSSFYPRPSWQIGVPGMPSGQFRLLPDVSLQASTKNPGFILCTADPSTGGSQSNSCSNGLKSSNGSYTVGGGTSFAAPVFAGFLAVLNQSQHTLGQGNINPTLYKLASDPVTYAAVFHDITSGSNACTAGASTCPTAGQSNYPATAGYDLATGLGSVDFNALATVWPSSQSINLIPTRITLSLTGEAPDTQTLSVTPGQSLDISIALQLMDPAGTNPISYLGTFSISLDGKVVNPSLPVPVTKPPFTYTASTSYTVTVPATVGSHILTVAYSGDGLHTASSRTLSLIAESSTPSGSIALNAGDLTVANNSTGTTQVTVTPGGGYTGRVVWSLTATAAAGTPQLSACYSIASLLVNNTASTPLRIGVGSACGSAQPQARVAIQAAQAHNHPIEGSTPRRAMYAGLVICGALGLRRRKRWTGLLTMILSALILSAGLAGCGVGKTASSESNNASTPPPVKNAAYTFHLTANDSVNSSIVASTSFTVTLQQ
jgi:subtilase family serine protease